MLRVAPTTVTSSSSSRWVCALFLLLVAATAQLSEAVYYGGYRGYGGARVVKRTVVVRRGRGVYGRRLLQKDEKPEKPEKPGKPDDDEEKKEKKEKKSDGEECETILSIIESRPELSQLAAALEDLPRIRAAMDQKNREDTFFAPTNDAIDELLAWGGFVEKAEVRGGGGGRREEWARVTGENA